MRWRTNARPRPEVGDTRRRRVFAWLPRRCDDGRTYWLERIVRVDVFRRTYDPGPYCGGYSPGDPGSVGWFRSHYEAPGGIHITMRVPR